MPSPHSLRAAIGSLTPGLTLPGLMKGRGALYAASSGLSLLLFANGVLRTSKRSTLSAFCCAHRSAYCPRTNPCVGGSGDHWFQRNAYCQRTKP